jgi:hypothetical protein
LNSEFDMRAFVRRGVSPDDGARISRHPQGNAREL